MSKNPASTIRNDLSAEGRELLNLIVQYVVALGFVAGDPSTNLGYKQCCVAIGAAPPHTELPWGRLLRKH